MFFSSCYCLILFSKKFYIRRNNHKVDSIETGRKDNTHFLPRNELEKCIRHVFIIKDDKILPSLLNFIMQFCLLALLNDAKAKKQQKNNLNLTKNFYFFTLS